MALESENLVKVVEYSKTETTASTLSQQHGSFEDDLLSVDNSRFGCDKGSQQSLDAALPAPEGGVVGL